MLTFIKKYKAAIIAAVLIAAVLVIAFINGGRIGENEAAPDSAVEAQTQIETTAADSSTALQTTAQASSSAVLQTTAPATQKNTVQSTSAQPVTEKAEKHTQPQTQPVTDKYKTDPIPKGKPKPVEPQEQTTEDSRIYCTFSISCATILDNKESMSDEIKDIVPDDGWILKPERVEITEGESVFDVLVRLCKDKNIHMEYSFTPVYNSAYIEGIANIYEFDCGELSGWMYKVNDWYPNYGCSRYVIQNDDTVEWNYTCSSGKDLSIQKNSEIII